MQAGHLVKPFSVELKMEKGVLLCFLYQVRVEGLPMTPKDWRYGGEQASYDPCLHGACSLVEETDIKHIPTSGINEKFSWIKGYLIQNPMDE